MFAIGCEIANNFVQDLDNKYRCAVGWAPPVSAGRELTEVSMQLRWSSILCSRSRVGLLLAAFVGAAVIAGCGSSSSSSSSAAGSSGSSGGSASATSTSSGSSGSVDTSSCGPKPGTAATGTPIVLGAINTKQPGTDFTDISN